MKKYRAFIDNNLFPGDCGLWYDVLIFDGRKFVHCVCSYEHCNSFTEAIMFYLRFVHKPWYTVHKISHHKYSKLDLKCLSLAA